jgi:hypothetical protein
VNNVSPLQVFLAEGFFWGENFKNRILKKSRKSKKNGKNRNNKIKIRFF